jgi:hypothetical protein
MALVTRSEGNGEVEMTRGAPAFGMGEVWSRQLDRGGKLVVQDDTAARASAVGDRVAGVVCEARGWR